MKNILVIIAISLAANYANAMWREGGGGRAVVCRDKVAGTIVKAELLDLFEAREIFGLTLTPGKATFQEQAQWLATKTKAADYNYYFPVDYYKLFFLDKVRFIGKDLELTPVNDSFEPLVPKYCGIEQVVNYHQSDIILVNKEIWDAFSPQNQIALAMHELAYKRDRDWGLLESSYFIRRFVGLMFSETKLEPYQRNPKREVNYFCENADNRMGTNMIYEFHIGGNKCADNPSYFCKTTMSFRTLNGQMVHDSTTLEQVDDLLRILDSNEPFNNFSVRQVLKSQIFAGMYINYTVIEKNNERVPLMALSAPGEKNFVELKCNRVN
jgi:hypothetical protein